MANGNLAGSVINIANSQPIANAGIDAKSAGGGDFNATSNNDGQWGPISVPEGTYDVTVTAQGFTPGDYPGIVVLDGVTTELPFALHPADLFG